MIRLLLLAASCYGQFGFTPPEPRERMIPGTLTVTPGTGTWSTSAGGSLPGTLTVTPGTGTWSISGIFNQGIYTETPGTGTWPVSGIFNQGAYTVTPGSGTFPTSLSSLPVGSNRILDSVTVTPGTGTYPVSGSFNQGSYTVTPGSGTFPVSAIFNKDTYTVTPGTGTFPVSLTALPTGSVHVLDTLTVTPGTGTFPVSAVFNKDSYTVTPGTGIWQVNLSTPANQGTFTVTQGTGNATQFWYMSLVSSSAVHDVQNSTVSVQQLPGSFFTMQLLSTQPVHDIQNSTISVQQFAGSFLTVQYLSTQPVHDIQNSTVTVIPGQGSFPVSSTYTIVSGTVTISAPANNTVAIPVTFPSTQTVNIAGIFGSTFGVLSPGYVQFITTQTVSVIPGMGTHPVSSTYTIISGTVSIQAMGNNTVAIPITYPSTPTIHDIWNSTVSVQQMTGTFLTVQHLSTQPVHDIQNSTVSIQQLSGSFLTVQHLSTQPVHDIQNSTITINILNAKGDGSTIGYGLTSTAVPVAQQWGNLGRTTIVFSTSNYLSETTAGGAPMTFVKTTTMTIVKGMPPTVTTAPSYTVTTGKTLRLQSCYFNGIANIPSTTVTFASSTLYGLIGTDANRQSGKPLFTMSFLMQTNIDTPPTTLTWPDGYELPSGSVFSLAHQASAATIREEYNCTGFEY